MFAVNLELSTKLLATNKMADLESVLQDVSYLMAMEKSKSGSKLAVTKKVALPDASVHCVVDMHLAKRKQRSFKSVYNQQLGESRTAPWPRN